MHIPRLSTPQALYRVSYHNEHDRGININNTFIVHRGLIDFSSVRAFDEFWERCIIKGSKESDSVF